jgi:hypothetical protein
MSHFAYVPTIVDGKGIVEQVIRIDQETLDTGAWGNPSDWIQTSYNTYGNQHPENRPLRGNFAGVGFTYDAVNDVFIAPSPFPSWVLNQSTWLWEAPVPSPQDGKMYGWDEALVAWVEVDESALNKRI